MTSTASDQDKKKVLFLCTHNSARSQMAEGLLRAMLEIGIDITASRSKTSAEFQDTIFDLAVTVCDRAKQACPICSTELELPSKSPRAREVIHRSFADPAAAAGAEEEQIEAFRQVRDEIKDGSPRPLGDDARRLGPAPWYIGEICIFGLAGNFLLGAAQCRYALFLLVQILRGAIDFGITSTHNF
ncbi:MAG: arsenate reductase ArsC [Methanothrix sp.]|nr:arsenate reductase ArsC [Methanothrix sp.]